jgi:hypothetical protein
VTDAAPPSLEQARSAVIRRVIVTFAALAVWRFGLALPIQGLDLSTNATLSGAALSRVSIFALGVIPWLSAVALTELACLLLPPSWTRRIADKRHAAPMALPIVALALAFSAFQGYGIAVALEGIRNLVPEPGDTFRLITSVTFVAGTALMINLARVIQSLGIGWGFWVLLAAQAIDAMAQGVVQSLAAIQQGAVAPLSVFWVFGLTIAVIAAVIVLLHSRREAGLNAVEPVIWPIQLYGMVVPWLAVILQIASGAAVRDGVPLYSVLLPHQPIGAVVMGLLIAAFVAAYARREGGLGVAAVGVVVLIGVAAVALVAQRLSIVYLPSATHIVLIATVGYVVSTALQKSWHGRT